MTAPLACDFLSGVTLKFDRWPWKTLGHLFYTMSSFVHHFKAIGEFKLELYSPETLNLGQYWRFFVLCDLEVGLINLNKSFQEEANTPEA